ncbi:hypothetical protein MACJ_003684 [Theileria orientalis]|uniref:Uncharacterized protein n=1 Tax=Theileria orientalis TaxID=68886 RepID=A0A976SLI0_THEOR|nr:hypothetical protein MACJ_003684 [Theileria orientalis]
MCLLILCECVGIPDLFVESHVGVNTYYSSSLVTPRDYLHFTHQYMLRIKITYKVPKFVVKDVYSYSTRMCA